MKSICPECKNNIDLSRYTNIKEGMVIECNHCGITLLIKNIKDNVISTDIVDEGKYSD
jgi:DNA-directed RNA polymerase subunit RPC12/RpoP